MVDLDATYFLCVWREGSDNDHSIIIYGMPAVQAWLRRCLWNADGGPMPDWVIRVLAQLDSPEVWPGSHNPLEMAVGNSDFRYEITEITHLGALSHREKRDD